MSKFVILEFFEIFNIFLINFIINDNFSSLLFNSFSSFSILAKLSNNFSINLFNIYLNFSKF